MQVIESLVRSRVMIQGRETSFGAYWEERGMSGATGLQL